MFQILLLIKRDEMEPQITEVIMHALHIACLDWENQGFGAWKEGGKHPGCRKDAGSAERP